MSLPEIGGAYTAAVASSCTIALGMAHWVSTKSPLAYRPLLSRAVPFVAVAAAGTLNAFLMRRKELTHGIDVRDEEGTLVGRSTVAGWTAVGQMATSRIVTALPALFVPSLIMSYLEKRIPALKQRPLLSMGTPRLLHRHTHCLGANLAVISGSLILALPFAVALFPSTASLSVNRLEASLSERPLYLKDGRTPVQTVYFNRGL